MMFERCIVIEALAGIKNKCTPLPELREKEYVFSSSTLRIVEEAGYQLKWRDTTRGGCWHIMPK